MKQQSAPQPISIMQYRQMTVAEVSALSVDVLAELQDRIAANERDAKILRDKFNEALLARYEETGRAKLKEKGLDTGTASIDSGPYVVAVNVPKRVEWDQSKLRQVVAQIQSEGGDPEDYVKIEIDVPESKFKAWPKPLQARFEPARTVKHGKITAKIDTKKVPE